jgi:respiratory burst oxidase
LARRRRQKLEKITKDELHDFWLQISDQSFDARLQIFFDMADSNEDGKITREEIKELLMLSASANKLAKLKEQAEEYASLIMEELDPENFGYIEVQKNIIYSNTQSTILLCFLTFLCCLSYGNSRHSYFRETHT